MIEEPLSTPNAAPAASDAGSGPLFAPRQEQGVRRVLLFGTLCLALYVVVVLVEHPQGQAVGSYSDELLQAFARLTPEPTADLLLGQTLDTAAPLGFPVLVEKGLRFTVQEVAHPRGADSHPPGALRALSRDGKQRFVVRLWVEKVGGHGAASMLFVASDFAALGESGVYYREACSSVPNRLGRLGTTIGPGQATEGNICLLVPPDDPIRFLLYEPPITLNHRYFRVAP